MDVCIYQQIPWLYIFKYIHTYMCICTSVSLKLPGGLAQEIANKPPTVTIWFRVRANAKRIYSYIMYIYICKHWHMGWLWSVGSIKLSVFLAEYCLFYRALLQKRPVIWSILLTKATPCHDTHTYSTVCYGKYIYISINSVAPPNAHIWEYTYIFIYIYVNEITCVFSLCSSPSLWQVHRTTTSKKVHVLSHMRRAYTIVEGRSSGNWGAFQKSLLGFYFRFFPQMPSQTETRLD